MVISVANSIEFSWKIFSEWKLKSIVCKQRKQRYNFNETRVQRKTHLYNRPNFANVFPWTKVETVNEIWQPNSSIPSLERKVIKIDPTAEEKTRGGKERRNSIKEYKFFGPSSLRTIRSLTNNETCGQTANLFLHTYPCAFVCYTISGKTNARKRSEIGKMVEAECKKGRRESEGGNDTSF